jgi:hypothetical protein
LPSRAFGVEIPLSASVAIAAWVAWLVIATIFTGKPPDTRPTMLPSVSEPE